MVLISKYLGGLIQFKLIDIDDDVFDEIKGDADTLAGLILELKGEIPHKKEIFKYHGYEFVIESVDNRRIKKIRFRLPVKK